MIALATSGVFAKWQPVYAARRIPTFPVRIVDGNKKPAVRGYLKIGTERSKALAQRFPNENAFGFPVGKPSGLTVLDIDASDERILADAIQRHGKTPVIVRSGSGHFQAWYRWNGERRAIRPSRSRPIDILGGGFVVAPPSHSNSGGYEIVQGSLDDLDSLPALQNIAAAFDEAKATNCSEGIDATRGRNNSLFRTLGREARACDDFDQLLDRARTLNSQFSIPMADSRVIGTAQSVWKMTLEGRNRFGQHGAFFPVADVDALVSDPYLLALLNWLRAHEAPSSEFWIADGLAEKLNWPRRQLADARRRAVEGGWISRLSPPGPGRPARFVWCEGRGDGTFVENSLPDLVGVKTLCSGAA